jgi:hypothetical protein
MNLTASMVAVVLGFPPTVMIGMLAMHRIERWVTGRGGGPPPLRLVADAGTAADASEGTGAGGGMADGEANAGAGAPRPSLRIVVPARDRRDNGRLLAANPEPGFVVNRPGVAETSTSIHGRVANWLRMVKPLSDQCPCAGVRSTVVRMPSAPTRRTAASPPWAM